MPSIIPYFAAISVPANGLPLALLSGAKVQFLETLDAGSEWAVRKALLRGSVPRVLADLS